MNIPQGPSGKWTSVVSLAVVGILLCASSATTQEGGDEVLLKFCTSAIEPSSDSLDGPPVSEFSDTSGESHAAVLRLCASAADPPAGVDTSREVLQALLLDEERILAKACDGGTQAGTHCIGKPRDC